MSGYLPIPEFCDTCASPNIRIRPAEDVYGAKESTIGLHVWYCDDCRALSQCHKGTHIPYGRMADAQTRGLRKEAHDHFDPLWQSGLMTRKSAYDWLARQLSIECETCHISWFSKEQLRTTINISRAYAAENLHKAEKRIERRKREFRDRIQYERDAIRRRKDEGYAKMRKRKRNA